jgi:dephospho-CoA kinase
MNTIELKQKYGIGLTGGIATGKSTVAEMVRKSGFLCIDADQLSRDAVNAGTDGLRSVVEKFGEAVLNDDGSLNRAALGQIIFNDAQKRAQLEQIIHPRIHILLDQHLESNGLIERPRFWFYEASLLFETNRIAEFSQIWCTYCDEQTQIDRVIKRNALTSEDAKKIIHSQMPAGEKADQSNIVIDTACSINELKSLVDSHLNNIK